MSRQVLRLVLLISCAHALVHVYELTFASVMAQVQTDDKLLRQGSSTRLLTLESREGASASGLEISSHSLVYLSNSWTLPFGFGALVGGWLADRYGSKRMLVIYLVGGGLASAAVAASPSYDSMLAAMFVMGSFASLLHPAGLSLVSRATTARHRGLALGYFGVFGSLGIAGAPFLAAVLLPLLQWRGVYSTLLLPGLVLGVLLLLDRYRVDKPAAQSAVPGRPRDAARWGSFAAYCVMAWLLGMTYRAFTLFLREYLQEIPLLQGWNIPVQSYANCLTGLALVVGVGGQYLAGHLCGRFHLERLLVGVLAANVPLLLWMGQAHGITRLAAAMGFAFVHFMWQPVGNSVIAKYVPAAQRSLGYGISFMVSFGAGSLGANVAGSFRAQGDLARVYPALALMVVAATLLAAVLRMVDNRRASAAASEPVLFPSSPDHQP